MSDSNRSGSSATGLVQNIERVGKGRASDDPAEKSQADTVENKPLAAKVSNTATIETVGANPNSQAEQERAQDDLLAQQDMAFWAMLMFFAASLTVLLTGMGIWLLKRTLDATLQAVKDTGEATEAMRDANEIAQDTSQRQLRAYVGTEDHAMIDFIVDQFNGHICKVYNRGQTPAYDVEIWSRGTALNTTEENPHHAKIFRGGEIEQSRAIIGPGQFIIHINRTLAPLTQGSYFGVGSGEVSIVWGGAISYRDAFGKRHKTTFKYFITGAGEMLPATFDLTACSRGNNAT